MPSWAQLSWVHQQHRVHRLPWEVQFLALQQPLVVQPSHRPQPWEQPDLWVLHHREQARQGPLDPPSELRSLEWRRVQPLSQLSGQSTLFWQGARQMWTWFAEPLLAELSLVELPLVELPLVELPVEPLPVSQQQQQVVGAYVAYHLSLAVAMHA